MGEHNKCTSYCGGRRGPLLKRLSGAKVISREYKEGVRLANADDVVSGCGSKEGAARRFFTARLRVVP
jgi:hypothetical protein